MFEWVAMGAIAVGLISAIGSWVWAWRLSKKPRSTESQEVGVRETEVTKVYRSHPADRPLNPHDSQPVAPFDTLEDTFR